MSKKVTYIIKIKTNQHPIYSKALEKSHEKHPFERTLQNQKTIFSRLCNPLTDTGNCPVGNNPSPRIQPAALWEYTVFSYRSREAADPAIRFLKFPRL